MCRLCLSFGFLATHLVCHMPPLLPSSPPNKVPQTSSTVYPSRAPLPPHLHPRNSIPKFPSPTTACNHLQGLPSSFLSQPGLAVCKCQSTFDTRQLLSGSHLLPKSSHKRSGHLFGEISQPRKSQLEEQAEEEEGEGRKRKKKKRVSSALHRSRKQGHGQACKAILSTS